MDPVAAQSLDQVELPLHPVVAGPGERPDATRFADGAHPGIRAGKHRHRVWSVEGTRVRGIAGALRVACSLIGTPVTIAAIDDKVLAAGMVEGIDRTAASCCARQTHAHAHFFRGDSPALMRLWRTAYGRVPDGLTCLRAAVKHIHFKHSVYMYARASQCRNHPAAYSTQSHCAVSARQCVPITFFGGFRL